VTLYRKLVLFTLAAAVVPLSVVGFNLLRGAERALAERISAGQLATARAAAEQVGRELDAVLHAVGGTAESFELGALDRRELRSLMLLVFRHSAHLEAVAILDQRGREVVPTLAGVRDGRAEPLRAETREAFLRALPREEARAAGEALVLSAPFAEPDRRPRLAAALSVPAAAGERWTLGVLVALDALREQADAAAGPEGAAFVVDAADRVVLASRGAVAGAADRRALASLRAAGGATTSYRDEAGREQLAAYAAAPGATGWGVLLRLPRDVALADVGRMRREVLTWSALSLFGFLLLGAAFVRGITSGLERIDRAARDLGRGDLSVRLPESGSDELARVSRTFNLMGQELRRARGQLERWNEELQVKVDERTRELEKAQAQLVEARKLAAIGQLGAGVAHEINNPLSGILGHAQLLAQRKAPGDPDLVPLRKIEEGAVRCREITENLLRFSEQGARPDFRETDLNAVVRQALTLTRSQIEDAGLVLDVALSEPPPRVEADARHLAQVLLNLLSNARIACAGRAGARIAIATGGRDGQAFVEVEDQGRGIAPEVMPRIFEPFFTTKDVWSNVGLGLSVSWRIVSEHRGRIEVQSRPGEGSTFTVLIPASDRATAAAV
jgi:C4-dicarboxylate-specific signal transduction histidine kinase